MILWSILWIHKVIFVWGLPIDQIGLLLYSSFWSFSAPFTGLLYRTCPPVSARNIAVASTLLPIVGGLSIYFSVRRLDRIDLQSLRSIEAGVFKNQPMP